MLATLLSLGAWQLHRRTWKSALLADIDRGEASPAIPLPQSPPAFAKVRVEGHFRDDLQALYGSDVRDLPNGSAIGAQLIEPLERPGEVPILVDRGWVPTDPAFIEPGTGTVEGYIRLPEKPGALSPSDDPESRRFYTLDPAAIGASLGLPVVAPFTLVALGTASPGVFPIPATALPRPPNDHLNYAITWFSLAAVLLVVFTLWSRKVLRP
jgi:surfeit locus 1 family protein